MAQQITRLERSSNSIFVLFVSFVVTLSWLQSLSDEQLEGRGIVRYFRRQPQIHCNCPLKTLVTHGLQSFVYRMADELFGEIQID